MLKNVDKAPFPWFGGKSQAASAVWAALGDVGHYVEPFCGSMAVLLNRPHEPNRPYYSETVCDRDGLLINAWRGIQLQPDATADAASNPVAEADLHARHLALVRWRQERQLEHLMGAPLWCDPVMAGWWLWGCSCWIGGGWCAGAQAWVLGDDDRICKRADKAAPGVGRQLPHLSDNGKGVNHASAREPGVSRQLPHLGNNGKGVNHPGAREPGVGDFHPVTMPELQRWFRYLSARLRHVRVVNGDWKRVCTNGALKTLSVRKGKIGTNAGTCGVFLDPPYSAEAKRDNNIYAVESLDVAHEVAQWALKNGDDPKLRIVVAGFDTEHRDVFASAGWSEIEWYKGGFLRGGMANTNKAGTNQQSRERIWLSPHCIKKGTDAGQIDLL